MARWSSHTGCDYASLQYLSVKTVLQSTGACVGALLSLWLRRNPWHWGFELQVCDLLPRGSLGTVHSVCWSLCSFRG